MLYRMRPLRPHCVCLPARTLGLAFCVLLTTFSAPTAPRAQDAGAGGSGCRSGNCENGTGRYEWPDGERYEGGRLTRQRTSSSLQLNWQVVDWAFLHGGVTTRQSLFDAETDALNFPLWDLSNQGNSALEVGGRLVF